MIYFISINAVNLIFIFIVSLLNWWSIVDLILNNIRDIYNRSSCSCNMIYLQFSVPRDLPPVDISILSEVKVTDSLVSNIGFSDYCLVTCQLLVNLPQIDPFLVESRKWKGFSVESFKLDLSKWALLGDLSWTLSASVDELFDRYSYEMSTMLNLHAPRCMKRRKSICSHHGLKMDAQLSNVPSRRLEKKYRRTRQDDDRKE